MTEDTVFDIKGNVIDVTKLYMVIVKDVDNDYRLTKDRISLKEGGLEHLFNTYLLRYNLFSDMLSSVVVLTDDQDTAWRLAVMLKQGGYYYDNDFISIR